MPHPTGYEPWMHEVVEDVYRSTHPPMLTLRCAETADLIEEPGRRASCARAQRFGAEDRQFPLKKNESEDKLKGNYIRREVEIHFRSPRFPRGVPIGVRRTGKYVRSQATGETSFLVLSDAYDISLPQMEVLKHLAERRRYPSDSDRARSRRLIAASEVNARLEKMDPQGTEERKAVTLAKAFVAAGIAGPSAAPAAAPSVADLSDEAFEAEAAKRRMAKARAAKGKKKDAEPAPAEVAE